MNVLNLGGFIGLCRLLVRDNDIKSGQPASQLLSNFMNGID